MKITKRSETVYEVEFDETEVRQLADIEAIFQVAPPQVIERSVEESLRLGAAGVLRMLDVITGDDEVEDGD